MVEKKSGFLDGSVDADATCSVLHIQPELEGVEGATGERALEVNANPTVCHR